MYILLRCKIRSVHVGLNPTMKIIYENDHPPGLHARMVLIYGGNISGDSDSVNQDEQNGLIAHL